MCFYINVEVFRNFIKYKISVLNIDLPRQSITFFSFSYLFDVTHFQNAILRHFKFDNAELAYHVKLKLENTFRVMEKIYIKYYRVFRTLFALLLY